jgi:hypothetical protein
MTPHRPELTHIDALTHVVHDGQVYPGVPLSERASPAGASSGSTAIFADGIVTRGVLLDLAPGWQLAVDHPAPGPIWMPRPNEPASRSSLVTRSWSAADGTSPTCLTTRCRHDGTRQFHAGRRAATARRRDRPRGEPAGDLLTPVLGTLAAATRISSRHEATVRAGGSSRRSVSLRPHTGTGRDADGETTMLASRPCYRPRGEHCSFLVSL